MTHGSHERPSSGRRRWWRWGTPAMVAVCGALFVVSAQNSHGTDLRPGRYTDLATLVGNESDRYDALRQQVSDLSDEIARMSDALGEQDVAASQREADRLEGPAGLLAQTGPGLTVTLSDAPASTVDRAEDLGADLNRFVVHQQDIQAVVNALWRGGATAITVAGQRIVSTTGIKCVGNSVTLQGVPYPQPYVIRAIGAPQQLESTVLSDALVAGYVADATDPAIAVGWSIRTETEVKAPAYDGLLDLTYAKPLR